MEIPYIPIINNGALSPPKPGTKAMTPDTLTGALERYLRLAAIANPSPCTYGLAICHMYAWVNSGRRDMMRVPQVHNFECSRIEFYACF
jgi:hypothetical protein